MGAADRIIVPYDDFDGISVLADDAALRTRYADHDITHDEDPFARSVAVRPEETLLLLANAREALSWGAHQPPGECVAVLSQEPFSAGELEAHGTRSTLEVGCLVLTGPLVVTAWHALTHGCDYRRGALESPRVQLPAGTWRVKVHRPFREGDEPGGRAHGPTTFLVELAAVPAETTQPLTGVPGADGWF